MKIICLTLWILLGLVTNVHAQFNRAQLALDWTCGVTDVGTTAVQCKAAPTVKGQKHYITMIVFQSTTATANQFSIRSGTQNTTPCDTTTTAIFPADSVNTKWIGVPNTVAPGFLAFYPTPLPVTANHAICILGIATQLTKMTMMGFTLMPQ